MDSLNIDQQLRELAKYIVKKDGRLWLISNEIQKFVNENDNILRNRSYCKLSDIKVGDSLYCFEMEYLHGPEDVVFTLCQKHFGYLVSHYVQVFRGKFTKGVIYANRLSSLTLPTADTLKYNSWWSPDIKERVFWEITSVIDTYLKLNSEGEIFRGKVVTELKKELEMYWERGMISSPRVVVNEKASWSGNRFGNIASDFPVYDLEPKETVKFSLTLLKDYLLAAITHPKEKSLEVLKKVPQHVLDEISVRIDKAFIAEKSGTSEELKKEDLASELELKDIFLPEEDLVELRERLNLDLFPIFAKTVNELHEKFTYITSSEKAKNLLFDERLYRTNSIWEKHLPESITLYLDCPQTDETKARIDQELINQMTALKNEMVKIANYINTLESEDSLKKLMVHGRFIQETTRDKLF